MSITIKCIVCKKERITYPSAIRRGCGNFCSRSCYHKSRIGKQTWNFGVKNWMSKDHLKNLIKGTIRRNTTHPLSTKQARANGLKATPRSGENHYRWKGGKKRTRYGYVYMLAKGHPRATGNGYVFEHIIQMEKHIGRYLEDGEVVHHLNEIKDDNRIENLQLMTRSDHLSHHHKGIKNPGKGNRTYH